MSNDLISREAVLKILYDIKDNPDTPKNYGTILDIIREVRNLQTAYDVDAVRNEIKKREKKFREYGEKYHDGEGISAADACAGDIEIVRNGGKK